MSITIKQESFEGPLDLLLHLIEKNKMNIYDIQIAPITAQYMDYIENMEQNKNITLDDMSDFIVMAATLLYIKSKMLLPKSPKEEEVEEDPRQELVDRLLEYKKIKYISEELKGREQDAQKIFFRNNPINTNELRTEPEMPGDALEGITLMQLYEAFNSIASKKKEFRNEKIYLNPKIIEKDIFTVKQKGRYILDLIKLNGTIDFYNIFDVDTSKMEMIITFMAMLELVHKRKIRIFQENMLDNILISEVEYD